MLIRTTIQNKPEVAKMFLQKMRNVKSPSKKQISAINIKHFSCALCLRFLNNPIRHSSCKFYFCRDCLVPWIKEFSYCNRCKQHWPLEEVEAAEVDEELVKVIGSIQIACGFGKCATSGTHKDKDQLLHPRFGGSKAKKMISGSRSKGNGDGEEEPDLEMIEERSKEWESREMQQNPFWQGNPQNESNLPKSRYFSMNNSKGLSISKSFAGNNSLTKSTNADTLQESLGLSKKYSADEKRGYRPLEYTFHLMKYHFWPALEIRIKRIRKKAEKGPKRSTVLEKYSEKFFEEVGEAQKDDRDVVTLVEFCGLKNGKPLGPGVRYFVYPSRHIDTHMGNFEGGRLANEATIFKNGMMVFDGGVFKGKKHGQGVERFEVTVGDHEASLNESDRRIQNYLEYRGMFYEGSRQGAGTLAFHGKFELFKKYFEENWGLNRMGTMNLDVLDSEEDVPDDIPLMKSKIDPGFDIHSLFSRLSPGLPINSERKITHFQKVEDPSNTYEVMPPEPPTRSRPNPFKDDSCSVSSIQLVTSQKMISAKKVGRVHQANRVTIYEGRWNQNLPVMRVKDSVEVKKFRNFEFKSVFGEENDLIWDKNGNVYFGVRNNRGKFEGKGVCKYQLGYVYTGDFTNNFWDGFGKLYNQSGIIYKGQFRRSTFHGDGVIYFRNGSKYKGSFAKGNMEGRGTMEYFDKRQYTGNFEKSNKNGEGVWTYLDGSKMEAFYQNGRIEGKAVHIIGGDGGKPEYVLRVYEKGKLVSQKKYGKRPGLTNKCCRVF